MGQHGIEFEGERVEPGHHRADLLHHGSQFVDQRPGLGQRLARRLDQIGKIERHFALQDRVVGESGAVMVRSGREQDILRGNAETVLLDRRNDIGAQLQALIDLDDDLDAIEQAGVSVFVLVLAGDEADLLDPARVGAGVLHLAVCRDAGGVGKFDDERLAGRAPGPFADGEAQGERHQHGGNQREAGDQGIRSIVFHGGVLR